MKRFKKVFTKGGCGVVGEVEVGSLVFLSIFIIFTLDVDCRVLVKMLR